MRIFQVILYIITCVLNLSAQLENVMVETYYISDANDATNTAGGNLEEGSVTYRIFIDLAKGYKLVKVYGDNIHPIEIYSSKTFYNHDTDGVSTGNTINRNRLKENLVTLDTWITLGQVSRSVSGAAFMGVLKAEDTDGSIIGGQNNDGGSAEIPGGLLINNPPEIGLGLLQSDGQVSSTLLPSNWFITGLIDGQTSEDTTIFSNNVKSSFVSKDFTLQNTGVKGIDENKNIILLAQLTTKGDISFKLNIEIEDPNGLRLKYVNRDSLLMSNEIYSPVLSYPALCGCINPDYLEYSKSFACSDSSRCKTIIKYGCLDSTACNYDPSANFNIANLCCYIGYCNDNDLTRICPNLPPRNGIDSNYSFIEPNPATDFIRLYHNISVSSQSYVDIYNSSGNKLLSVPLMDIGSQSIDISGLNVGYYFVVIRNRDILIRNKFIKY